MVPAGYLVNIYDSYSFNGKKTQYRGSWVDYHTQEMACINLADEDKNTNKSVEIVRGREEGIVGQWVGITATESQTFTYTVGITKGDSQESNRQVMDKFSVGAEASFSFMGASAKVTMGYEKATTESETMKTSYSFDEQVKWQTTCTANDNQGTALYQWMIQTGDRKDAVFTMKTVCKSGDNDSMDWLEPPACPPSECANADCSQCTRDQAEWAHPGF